MIMEEKLIESQLVTRTRRTETPAKTFAFTAGDGSDVRCSGGLSSESLADIQPPVSANHD